MSTRFSMSVALLCLVLVGLAAFQVVHGLLWIDNLRAQLRSEFVAEVARGHDELVRNLAGLYGSGGQHARNLAASPALRGFVRQQVDRRALDAHCLPYLLSFDHLDRVVVIDGLGRELYRCERIGQGAGSLPRERLGKVDATLLQRLQQGFRKRDFAVSDLSVEEDRVEVREVDREVVYYLCPIASDPLGTGATGAAPAIGSVEQRYLLLTLYASTMLAPVRAFHPLPSTHSALCESGQLRWLERTPGIGLDAGSGWMQRLALQSCQRLPERGWLEGPHGLALSGSIVTEPAVSLVTVLPAEELTQRVSPWQRGGVAVMVSMGVATLLTLGVFVAVLFLSRRAWQQRELQRTTALAEAETLRLRALIDNSADLVLVVDAQTGRLREANQAARVFLGLATTNSVDVLLREILEPATHAPLYSALEEANRNPRQPVATGTFALTGEGGEQLLADLRCVTLEFDEAPVILVACRDRTREKQAERQLLIDDRLSSLGMITAGVAHEINNPLEGIGNYLMLLQKPTLDEEKQQQYLGRIQQGFDRIRDLVRDLLAFGKTQPRIARIDLVEIIDRALRLAKMSGHFQGVEVEREGFDGGSNDEAHDASSEACGRSVEVTVDAGQIEQVFLNLFLNSARAMTAPTPTSTTTTSSAASTTADPVPARRTLTLRLVSASPTPYAGDRGRGEVVVQVDDQGPGFPEDAIDRVFDPFFSRSDGSGLGLSIAYGIVEAHGGTITATNRAGGGARVTVTLPASPSQETRK